MQKSKCLLAVAGLFGTFSVILGAFAAHGLKNTLSPYLIGVFETGVQYQMMHTLALAACGFAIHLFKQEKAQKYFFIAAICFIIGILFFSGSLYVLALTGIKWFGPITPMGGMMFIVGWCTFSFAAISIKEVSK